MPRRGLNLSAAASTFLLLNSTRARVHRWGRRPLPVVLCGIEKLFGGRSVATPTSPWSLRSQRKMASAFARQPPTGMTSLLLGPRYRDSLQRLIWAPFCSFAHCVYSAGPRQSLRSTPAFHEHSQGRAPLFPSVFGQKNFLLQPPSVLLKQYHKLLDGWM